MGDAQLCARLEPGPWFSASFCGCEAEESLLSSPWPRGCAALAQHSLAELELPLAPGADACLGEPARNSWAQGEPRVHVE